MRRRIAVTLAVALVMSMLGATPVLADSHGDGEGGTYLALGDSVAAGTQQPAPFTDNGYADLLYDKLERKYDFDEFVNLACPGDDTLEMLDGTLSDGSVCYGYPEPPAGDPLAAVWRGEHSQVASAVEYLLANAGEVELITLTVGANDVLACSPGFDPVCLANAYGTIMGGATPTQNGSLGQIITALQTAAPGVPIVAMNYYQPNLAFWLVDPDIAEGALQLTAVGNPILEGVYGLFDGVHVADVETAFKTFETKGKKIPKNVKEVCKLTLMCEKDGKDYVLSDYDPATPGPQTDIHPSNKGHKKIAKTFEKLIKKQKLVAK